MAEEPSLENGETPRKKVRRRVGACPEFLKLAQKRKGKPEVISFQLLLLFHTVAPAEATNFSFAFPTSTSLVILLGLSRD